MFPSLRRRGDVETKTVETINWATPSGEMPDWLAGRRRRNALTIEQAVYGAYERTVWLWRGVSFMAGHAARLPFKYRTPGTDKTHDDHPIVRLLQPHTQVNPLEKGRAFKRRLFIQVMLSPRGAFVELTRSRGGDIIRLDLLPPGRTRAVPSAAKVDDRVLATDKLVSHFEVKMPDGNVRKLQPEQVWWIRDPHPLDPFKADTVLGALGASVEMDDLGRQININWMLNDGMVRAVVGVKGGLSPEDTAKLERRFGRGPVDAGKVSVVNAEQVTYADVSARPKDMQYEKLARNAKEEILGGIGVPESLLGISKGSTFDNAAQDKFNFWSETMPPPLELIAAELVDPQDELDLEPFFDLSGVEALQLPQRAKREEARGEVAAGLRTIESYAEVAGYELHSTPETRALWLPNTGKLQVPQTAADVAELEKRREEMAEQMRPREGGPDDDKPTGEPKPPANPARTPGQARPAEGTSRSTRSAGDAAAGGRDAAKPATGAGASDGDRAVGKAAVPRYRLETKAAETVERAVMSDDVGQQAAEDAAVAALTALTVRWAARTSARLRSPKSRKGTRHWQADPSLPHDTRVGVKALDTGDAVDPDSWEQDAVDALTPLLDTAAIAAATAAATALTGVAPAAVATAGAVSAAVLTAGALTAAKASVGHLAAAAKEAGQRLAARLAADEAAGQTVEQLAASVDAGQLLAWAKTTARHAAAAAVTGGLYAAARAAKAIGLPTTATWTSRQDLLTRVTHKTAHGQTQPVGTRFKVGVEELRYPRDPAGSVAETVNCRCKLRVAVELPGRRSAP